MQHCAACASGPHPLGTAAMPNSPGSTNQPFLQAEHSSRVVSALTAQVVQAVPTAAQDWHWAVASRYE